jgi:hypothetical protein
MRCYFLLIVDEHEEVAGCVYADTPGGHVIVLFQGENEPMRVIGRHAVNSIPALHSLRSMYLEVSSPKEAARELEDAFPELRPIIFLTDSHPFIVQLVARLRKKEGSRLIRIFRK